MADPTKSMLAKSSSPLAQFLPNVGVNFTGIPCLNFAKAAPAQGICQSIIWNIDILNIVKNLHYRKFIITHSSVSIPFFNKIFDCT